LLMRVPRVTVGVRPAGRPGAVSRTDQSEDH